MRKLFGLLILFLLVGVSQAGFIETFEGTTAWTPMPAEWDVPEGGVQIGGGEYAWAGGADRMYKALRLAGETTENTVYATLRVSASGGTYYDSIAQLAMGSDILTTSEGRMIPYVADGYGDGAMIGLYGGSTPKVQLHYSTCDDTNGTLYNHIESVETLLANTWYDVKMTLVGTDLTGWYKQADATEWIEIGTVTHGDLRSNPSIVFNYEYVMISGSYAANFDDIASEAIPEPATIGLLVIGAVAIRRRR